MRTLKLCFVVALAGVFALPATSMAFDEDWGAPVNIKDKIIEFGAGRSDREGDGLPDTFQAWLMDVAIFQGIQVNGKDIGESNPSIMETNQTYYLGGGMLPFGAFSFLGPYYGCTSPAGYNYWQNSVAVPNGFSMSDPLVDPNWDADLYGNLIAPGDDPDGDGFTNQQEWDLVLAAFKRIPNKDWTTWNDVDWGNAFEDDHGLGVGPAPGLPETDVMSAWANVALDPARTPEPATLAMLGLGGVMLLRRRR
jgi:hypothetical protein